jgi:transcriptional regulator with XRE-family HTH domain
MLSRRMLCIVALVVCCSQSCLTSTTLGEVDDLLLRRLGQRIRELRADRGWSQEELADVSGVHRTYIGHLERGETNVTLISLVRISDGLRITVRELLEGLETPTAASARVSDRGGLKKLARSRVDNDSAVKELRAALQNALRAARKLDLTTAGPVKKAPKRRGKR